jgi:hypothetical protein
MVWAIYAIRQWLDSCHVACLPERPDGTTLKQRVNGDVVGNGGKAGNVSLTPQLTDAAKVLGKALVFFTRH